MKIDSSLFSWILQGIKDFLTGGFHFLITLFFPVILIDAIFHLGFLVFFTVVNLNLIPFGPRRRPGTSRLKPNILKLEKHGKL